MARRISPAWAWCVCGLMLIGCSRDEPPPVVDKALIDVDTPLPVAVINDQVVALLWLDMANLSGEAIHQTLGVLHLPSAASPGQTPRTLDEAMPAFARDMIERYTLFREAFLAAGGKAIVIGAAMPADDAAARKPFLLLKVAAGTDPGTFSHSIDVALGAPATTTLATYAPGWLAVQGEQLAAPPTDGTAQSAAGLQSVFEGTPVTAVRLGVRLTDVAKQALARGSRMGGSVLIDPLLDMQIAGVSLALGTRPALATRMQFRDAQAATRFNSVYAALIERVQASLLSMDAGDADAQALADACRQLHLTQNAASLTLSLDHRFAAHAHRIAPALTPLMVTTMQAMQAAPVTVVGP